MNFKKLFSFFFLLLVLTGNQTFASQPRHHNKSKKPQTQKVNAVSGEQAYNAALEQWGAKNKEGALTHMMYAANNLNYQPAIEWLDAREAEALAASAAEAEKEAQLKKEKESQTTSSITSMTTPVSNPQNTQGNQSQTQQTTTDEKDEKKVSKEQNQNTTQSQVVPKPQQYTNNYNLSTSSLGSNGTSSTINSSSMSSLTSSLLLSPSSTCSSTSSMSEKKKEQTITEPGEDYYQTGLLLKNDNEEKDNAQKAFSQAAIQGHRQALSELIQLQLKLKTTKVESKNYIYFANQCIKAAQAKAKKEEEKKYNFLKLALVCYQAALGNNDLETDEKAADVLYQLGCEFLTLDKSDDALVCFLIHDDLSSDKTDTKNNASTEFSAIKQTAEKNNSGDAWFNLGECYAEGYGTEIDIKKAAECYEKAIANKFLYAHYSLANALFLLENYKDAFKHIKQAVQQGIAEAQESFVAIEEAYIAELKQKQNDLESLITLGDLYTNIHFDIQEAKGYYQRAAIIAAADEKYKSSKNPLFACGQDFETDSKKSHLAMAFYCYDLAARQQYIDAQRALARCYSNGIGTTKDLNLALATYNKIQDKSKDDTLAIADIQKEIAAEQKQAEDQKICKSQQACFDYAAKLKKAEQEYRKYELCYASDITSDETKAIAQAQWRCSLQFQPQSDDELCYLHQAANNNHPEAAYALGMHAFEKKNYPLAFAYFQKASNSGCVYAYANLGLCYQQGLGIGQNIDTAQECYLKVLAAKNQDLPDLKDSKLEEAKKAYVQGSIDFNDKKDKKGNTVKILATAITGRFIPAYYLRGKCYEALKNDSEAKADYLVAAQYGHADAQYRLAELLKKESQSNKTDMHTKKSRIFTWYKLAAANGSTNALFKLGECYENGFVVGKNDEKKAIELYTQAAYKWHLDAMRKLIGKNTEKQKWTDLLSLANQNSYDMDDEAEDDVEALPSVTDDEKKSSKLTVSYKDQKSIDSQIEKFELKIQKQLKATIQQFQCDPLNKTNALDIKKLKDQGNAFRIRCGKQRIKFKKDGNTYIITSIERRDNNTY